MHVEPRRPGASPGAPEPRPSSSSPLLALDARSAIATCRPGEPTTRPWPSDELDVLGRRLQLLRGHAPQLQRDLVGGDEHGAAVVERRLGPGRTHVVRAGVRVLVDQREVLGRHPELVRGELAERHDRARPALLRARHDHARAVGVELHVGPGGGGEGGPPADRDPDRLVLGQVLAVAREGRGLLEALARADRGVDLAAGALGALDEHVAPAQLQPVQPDRPRDLVHVLLHRPARLGRRRARGPSPTAGGACRRDGTRSPRSGSRTGRPRASRPAAGRTPRRRCRRRCRSRPCRAGRRSARRA